MKARLRRAILGYEVNRVNVIGMKVICSSVESECVFQTSGLYGQIEAEDEQNTIVWGGRTIFVDL